MNDTQAAEMAMWDVRCNDLQNSLDRMREDRDDIKVKAGLLETALAEMQKEISIYKQMVERMRIALSQGIEL